MVWPYFLLEQLGVELAPYLDNAQKKVKINCAAFCHIQHVWFVCCALIVLSIWRHLICVTTTVHKLGKKRISFCRYILYVCSFAIKVCHSSRLLDYDPTATHRVHCRELVFYIVFRQHTVSVWCIMQSALVISKEQLGAGTVTCLCLSK